MISGRGRSVVLLLIVVAALSVGLLWILGESSRPGVGSRSNGRRESGRAGEPIVPPAAADGSVDRARTTEEIRREPLPSDRDGPANARVVRGRVIVVDRDLHESLEEDGELVLALPRSPELETAPFASIAVQRGGFEWSAPPGDSFEIRRVAIAGLPTLPEKKTLELDPQLRPVVRVNRIPSTILRVFDADSGDELPDVSVLSPKRWRERLDPDACSKAEQVLLHRHSPIEVNPRIAESGAFEFKPWWFLVAPFHETERIELDLALGGEHEFHLGAGAAVEVTVRGLPIETPDPDAPAAALATPLVKLPPRPIVRLRQRDPWDIDAHVRDALAQDATLTEAVARANTLEEIGADIVAWRVASEIFPHGERPMRVDGLSPGHWTVSAEIGDEDDRRPPLAWAQVELHAGSVTPVTLQLHDLAPPPPPAPLRGLVEVPESWHSEGWSLELRSAERDRSQPRLTIARAAMAPESGRPDRFHFAVDAVTPGTYVARVTGFEVQVAFEQIEGHGSDVVISVPPPAEVELVLRERSSGATIDVGTISLTPERSPVIFNWCSLPFTFDATRRAYPLRVPRGSYDLEFEDGRYREPAGMIDVSGESTRIECDLDAACGAIVRLLEGDAPLSTHDVVQRVRLYPKHGEVGQRYYYEADRVRIVVKGPGTYELSVDVPRGFRPIDSREIVLHDGEFVPLDLHLER